MQKNKGQIPIWTIIIPAIATVLASLGGSFGTASYRVGQVDAKVQVVEEREQNHYAELSKKMDNFDKKLDILINKK